MLLFVFFLPISYDICWVTSQGANKNHPPSKRESACVYPSCVAHHSCKASREDSTAGANVQSFGSLIKLVMQKLQGVSMLGKEGTQQNHCVTTLLAAGPPWLSHNPFNPSHILGLLASAKCFILISSDVLSWVYEILPEVRSCQDNKTKKSNIKLTKCAQIILMI